MNSLFPNLNLKCSNDIVREVKDNLIHDPSVAQLSIDKISRLLTGKLPEIMSDVVFVDRWSSQGDLVGGSMRLFS